MKKSEVFNFRLDPIEAVQVKRFARLHGFSFSELIRGSVFQVMQQKSQDGSRFLELPESLPDGVIHADSI